MFIWSQHNAKSNIYSIKIRVETPEMKFLSVALLSQCRKSECGMAHNTLVDLIFVRALNIPNLSLLPCLEVFYVCFGQTNVIKANSASHLSWSFGLAKLFKIKKALGSLCLSFQT